MPDLTSTDRFAIGSAALAAATGGSTESLRTDRLPRGLDTGLATEFDASCSRAAFCGNTAGGLTAGGARDASGNTIACSFRTTDADSICISSVVAPLPLVSSSGSSSSSVAGVGLLLLLLLLLLMLLFVLLLTLLAWPATVR
jgi:hypothetical protein